MLAALLAGITYRSEEAALKAPDTQLKHAAYLRRRCTVIGARRRALAKHRGTRSAKRSTW